MPLPRGLRPELTLPKLHSEGEAWGNSGSSHHPEGREPQFPSETIDAGRPRDVAANQKPADPRGGLPLFPTRNPGAPPLLTVLGCGVVGGGIPTLAVTMCSPKCRIRSPRITRGSCSADSRGRAAPSRRKHR